MNEANPRPEPTQRQKILLDVFRIMTDVGLEARTTEQLLLLDRITTYVDEKITAVASAEFAAGYRAERTGRGVTE